MSGAGRGARDEGHGRSSPRAHSGPIRVGEVWLSRHPYRHAFRGACSGASERRHGARNLVLTSATLTASVEIKLDGLSTYPYSAHVAVLIFSFHRERMAAVAAIAASRITLVAMRSRQFRPRVRNGAPA